MKKKNFTMQLPFFCGFYQSPFLNSDSLLEIEAELGRELEYGEFSYEDYEEEICRKFCRYFYELSPESIEKVEFSGLSSPKYYNYSTDRMFADVELSEEWRDEVLEFISSNKEWLEKRITDDWSDRDGFWSFLSNNLNDWISEIKSEDPDPNYLSSMIGYMMLRESSMIKWELTERVLEDVCIGNFVNVPEEFMC